jgi:deoxycytidylate deaminase
MSNDRAISYPYLPAEKSFQYVSMDNEYIQAAEEYARENSLDKNMPTGSVVVLDGKIIGRGANGSNYHETHECERVKRGIPTGQGYELCEGCHPKNHSEPRAIADAKTRHSDLSGASLYLWGHWWCCEPCWTAIIEAGIKTVCLAEGSEHLFNKESPQNIVGRQFVA